MDLDATFSKLEDHYSSCLIQFPRNTQCEVKTAKHLLLWDHRHFLTTRDDITYPVFFSYRRPRRPRKEDPRERERREEVKREKN